MIKQLNCLTREERKEELDNILKIMVLFVNIYRASVLIVCRQ